MSSKGEKALLEWAILNQSPDAVANAANGAPRPPVDTSILEVMFPDPIKQMRSTVESVRNDAASEEDMEVCLENLDMILESVDNANMLKNMDGIEPLVRRFQSEHAGIRSRAASCMATAMQQNPRCWAEFAAAGVIQKLVAAMNTEPVASVRKKILLALSAYLRQNSEGEQLFFTQYDGVTLLINILKGPDEDALKRRVLFLLESMLNDKVDKNSQLFMSYGLLPVLAELMSSPDVDVQEKVIVLTDLLAQHAPNRAAIGSSEIMPRVRAYMAARQGQDLGDDLGVAGPRLLRLFPQ